MIPMELNGSTVQNADPYIARFAASDPVFDACDPPMLHQYLYCGNDPVTVWQTPVEHDLANIIGIWLPPQAVEVILATAVEWLGESCRVTSHPDVYESEKGDATFRMQSDWIAGTHGRAPDVAFEFLQRVKNKRVCTVIIRVLVKGG